MPRMTKATKAVDEFIYKNSLRATVYAGSWGGLTLPRSFTPKHVICVQKEGNTLFIVALTNEKYYILSQSYLPQTRQLTSELESKLRQAGIRRA